jgi:putative ABC transport system permease protein
VGALIGLVGGYAIAGVALHLVGGDLGAGYFNAPTTTLSFAPAAAVLFFGFGVATAVVGSYAPARRAARIAPALALKDAGDQGDPRQPPSILPAVTLIGAGFVCAFLPAVSRLPLFGYLAVGLVLAGGVAGMPWLARRLLRPAGPSEAAYPRIRDGARPPARRARPGLDRPRRHRREHRPDDRDGGDGHQLSRRGGRLA